jgi:hypothetical protein
MIFVPDLESNQIEIKSSSAMRIVVVPVGTRPIVLNIVTATFVPKGSMQI